MALSVSESIELGVLIAEAAVAIVLTPEFLKYNTEQKERRARIKAVIETINPQKGIDPIYGLDSLIDRISDVIHRVKEPIHYAHLAAGNEILIVGPSQSGKKALAYHIAKNAHINRVITVYNPSDTNALAHAKLMIEHDRRSWRAAARHLTGRTPFTTMLLLPNLDSANGHTGETWQDQLEALIETASTMPNVLVVGTCEKYDRNNEVASWFGTVLPFPVGDDFKKVMRETAEGYLDAALKLDFKLVDIQREAFIEKMLAVAANPSELKDIMVLCQTSAIFNKVEKCKGSLNLTENILRHAIDRVVPKLSSPETKASQDAQPRPN
jgi:hypothetical protein